MYGAGTMPLSADLASTSAPPASQPLRRSGRARTSRVRDDFIDTTLLAYVTPPDEPHAFAEEDEPSYNKKSPAPKLPTPKGPASGIAYEDPDNRPVGTNYQASIPTLRPRPAQATASEAKFLQLQPLYAADPQGAASSAARAAAAAAFKARYQAAPDAAARRSLLEAAVQELDAQLGPHMVKVLQLDSLGYKLRASWQTHEDLLFCLGMCDKYRFFKYIRQCYLWQRSAHELNGYYSNVWKTRSTPEADEYMSLREQGASSADMLAFVDRIRDRLLSMWDRKKMGDMPKLLKDAAAAAAADEELQAAITDALCSEGAAMSPSASLATVSDDSFGAAKSAAAAAVVVSKPKQRKRPAAGAVSSKQRQLVVKEEPQQRQGAPEALPTPTGAPSLQQWLQQPQQQQHLQQEQQQKHLQQEQQPQQQVVAVKDEPVVQQPKRQRHQQQHAPAGAATLAPGAGAGDVVSYPVMPTYPEPDMGNAAAVEDWLKHIPAYQGVIEEYVRTVNCLTDSAVEGFQRRIQEAQQHRDRLQTEADAYIRSLLMQGQDVLRKVEAHTAAMQQQLQQPQQLTHAPAPAPVPAQQQQQAHVVSVLQQQSQQQQQAVSAQQHVQQQQQQQQAAQQGGTGDLQSAVHQLLLTHTKRTKKQLQAKLTGVSAAAQPAQQQQQQEDAPEALPFPGGPASKWLGQSALEFDGKRSRQDLTAHAVGALTGSPVEAGCGASSSEECDMFLACPDPTVC